MPCWRKKFRIVFHHFPCGVHFARELQRSAAAYAPLFVGPPHFIAGRFENVVHRAEDLRGQQRHAAGEVADFAVSLRTVDSPDISVTVFADRYGRPLAAVQPQRILFDTDRAGLFAATAHQAVVGHRIGQVAAPQVAQEVDRLHAVDPGGPLQLAGVDADAAARAGVGLEMVVARRFFFAAQPPRFVGKSAESR